MFLFVFYYLRGVWGYIDPAGNIIMLLSRNLFKPETVLRLFKKKKNYYKLSFFFYKAN